MGWESEVGVCAKLLGMSSSAADPVGSAALLLVRGASELVPLCQAAGDHDEALSTLLRWAQLVAPAATDRDIRRLTGHFAKAAPLSPSWMKGYSPDAGIDPRLLVMGLIATIPLGLSHADLAWNYVGNASSTLGVDFMLADARGWLRGEASDNVADGINAVLASAATVNDLSRTLARELDAFAARARQVAPQPPFLEARKRVLQQVDVVLQHADELHVDRTALLRLREYATNDYFRLAVLGEFKRGKSTLINALTGKPDLMPEDPLPCTSALTELHYGPREEYRRRGATDLSNAGKVQTRAQFRASAANAATTRSGKDGAAASAESVPRWRITVASPFLEGSFLELVDSPGLGEDYARDFLAKEEAQRADAAILVFSAQQIASQMELDLIESMQAKLENLIIAVNLADTVAEADRERIRRHALARLAERGLKIPDDRMLLVSALEATNAQKRGDTANPWASQMQRLRSTVQQHLLAKSGPRKATVLGAKVRDVVTRSGRDVETTLELRRSRLKRLEHLEADRTAAHEAYTRAQASIEEATATIAVSSDAFARLMDAFGAALPEIMRGVGETQGEWTTKYHPLSSPKKHVEDVANKAKTAVLQSIETWFRDSGAEILTEEVQRKLDAATETASSLQEYLRAIRGEGDDELGRWSTDLQVAALSGAFGSVEIDSGSATGTLSRVVVGTVVATVVGYIIADIILFYVLGLISGLLNPILLGAAVVTGVALWIFKGEDWVRDWIRSSIFSTIAEKISAGQTLATIRTAMEKPISDVFATLARSFRTSAQDLLAEASHQEKRVAEELERLAREGGSKEAVERELLRLQSLAEGTRGALQDLKAVADSLLPSLTDVKPGN